ncbi:ATP F0F1 synthase subunit B' [Acuticoccus sediminis]|uniref:ATP synthase subunit b n=1 Tax=Acuticoccus sediminis TaxID=2184697 RepID=A0A8B2NMX4_9HYPH|nr:F0F1 ATP synthase subunit B [Acuticoccus sediminis]RAH99960.1 ATP F0F1 synthase subunit B' [Acuticoccus sediminis]
MSKLELAQVEVAPDKLHPGDLVDTGTTGTHITHPDGSVVEPLHGGGESIFPPFDFDAFPSHLFWLAISFGILFFFVNRVIMPKVGGILEDRRDRIASDLGEASRLSRETDEVIAAYERELSEARQRAYAIAHERREEIKAEQARQQAETEAALGKRIAEAEAEIAARRDAALADVNTIASGAAQAIVQKLSGVAITPEDAGAAVSQAEGARA